MHAALFLDLKCIIYIWNAAVIQIQNLAYENLFFKFSWKLKFIHKLLGYIHILIIKLSPTFFLPVQKVIECLDFNWNSWASQIKKWERSAVRLFGQVHLNLFAMM